MIKKILFSWVGLFIWTSALYNFGYRHFIVPSESMESTLMVGDIYIGDMHAYGLNMPTLYGVNLTKPKQFIEFNNPSIGDIIIFAEPKNNNLFVKRIFGIPGDLIEITKDDKFYRNGKLITEEYTQYTENNSTHGFESQLDRFNEGDESKFSMNLTTENRFSYIVPINKYFVLGDNRNHSYDSRFFGAIERSSILGRGSFRVFSMQDETSYKDLDYTK